jgi:hypothetical protein
MKPIFKRKRFGKSLSFAAFESSEGIFYLVRERSSSKAIRDSHLEGPFESMTEAILDALLQILNDSALRELFYSKNNVRTKDFFNNG